MERRKKNGPRLSESEEALFQMSTEEAVLGCGGGVAGGGEGKKNDAGRWKGGIVFSGECRSFRA